MGATPQYRCWEEHAEDLTEKVKDALANPSDGLHLYFRKRRGGTRQAKLFVTCSEGHLNVFEVPAEAGD